MITNLNEKPWSGDISFSTGVEEGALVVYYCPPGLQPQPGLHEGAAVTLNSLEIRPGEVFVFQLY